jgi:hypothetical protein
VPIKGVLSSRTFTHSLGNGPRLRERLEPELADETMTPTPLHLEGLPPVPHVPAVRVARPRVIGVLSTRVAAEGGVRARGPVRGAAVVLLQEGFQSWSEARRSP